MYMFCNVISYTLQTIHRNSVKHSPQLGDILSKNIIFYPEYLQSSKEDREKTGKKLN